MCGLYGGVRSGPGLAHRQLGGCAGEQKMSPHGRMLCTMNKDLAGYLAAAFVIVALDLLWLGLIAKAMSQQAIAHVVAEQPRLGSALAFCVLYLAGLMMFAVMPHAADPAWGKTVLMGAVFGFLACATDDLSNLATLRNWPAGLTLVDMAWGTRCTVPAGLPQGCGSLRPGKALPNCG